MYLLNRALSQCLHLLANFFSLLCPGVAALLGLFSKSWGLFSKLRDSISQLWTLFS